MSERIQFNQELLLRTRREVKSQVTTDLVFSGKQTPKVLFNGFSKRKVIKEWLEADRWNSHNELVWFTNSPNRAAAYGMYIESEWREEAQKRGFTHYQEDGHTDFYEAIGLKNDLIYVSVIFPHEDTDLGRWVIDKSGPTAFINAQEYITDQDMSLDSVLFVRIDALRPWLSALENGQLSTRAEFVQALGITQEQQQYLRDSLR